MIPDALRRYEIALEYVINTDEFASIELRVHGRNDLQTLFKIAELEESNARFLEAVAPPAGREEFHAETIASARALASMARQRGLYLTTWPPEILERSDLFDALDKRAQRLCDRLAPLQRH